MTLNNLNTSTKTYYIRRFFNKALFHFLKQFVVYDFEHPQHINKIKQILFRHFSPGNTKKEGKTLPYHILPYDTNYICDIVIYIYI